MRFRLIESQEEDTPKDKPLQKEAPKEPTEEEKLKQNIIDTKKNTYAVFTENS